MLAEVWNWIVLICFVVVALQRFSGDMGLLGCLVYSVVYSSEPVLGGL
jgi:hypothetical protein